MKFASAYYAYGIWVIPIAVAFYLWMLRRKRAALHVFAEDALLERINTRASARKRVLKFSLLMGAVFTSFAALMRPQWGFTWQEVTRRGLDVLIAVDTSKSMLASDVKPNRLKRSQLAIKDLVKKLGGDRVGLIAFSGTAFLQCPLTVDYNGFLLALNDISVKTIPRGGTSISSAIDVAMKSYEGGEKKYKVLVIITDGEDHEGNSIARAEEAKKEGIKIFCIGIGTAEGDLIQVTDEKGKKSFLRDRDGNVVKSRLNEGVLKRIASITGGMYVRSSGADFGLDLIYDERLSKMETREVQTQMSKLYYERFQIPLGLALLLLVLELLITDMRKL